MTMQRLVVHPDLGRIFQLYRAGALVLSSIFIGVAPIFSVANAQSASTGDGSETTAPTEGLGEIVVTARKRAESLQDVPVAITALSSADLERYNLTSMEDIASSTPTLMIGRTDHGSGASLTIRGIGAAPLSISFLPSVAVVVDEAYYSQGRIINEGLFDVGSVQILKGPQALFYGENATAGVIAIKTADPTDRTEAVVSTGYEFTAEEAYGEAMFSTPLSPTLGVRIAIQGAKQFGGYLNNVANPQPMSFTDVETGAVSTHPRTSAGDQPGEDDFNGRITFKWTPTDKFTATLKAYGTIDDTSSPDSNVVIRCAPGETSYQADPSQPCLGKTFQTIISEPPAVMAGNLNWGSGKLFNRYSSAAVNATAVYDFGDVTLTSVSNYNWSMIDLLSDDTLSNVANSFASQGYTGDKSAFHALSEEARIVTSFDVPVNILAGGYYQTTHRTFVQTPSYYGLYNPAVPTDLQYLLLLHDAQQASDTLSAYGQVIWKVVPTIEATGGVRYTKDDITSGSGNPYVDPAVTSVYAVETIRVPQSFDNWSPEATISWKPISKVNLYAGYKTGFKAGGYSISDSLTTTSTAASSSYGPERARGFESGVKTELLDRQLRLNMAGYTYGYDGLQLEYFNGTQLKFETLSSDARTKGIELDAEYAPRAVSGLTLNSSLNYNKATYTKFLAPCYGGQSIAAGCTITLPDGVFQDRDGQTLSNAPHWTASLGATYETPINNAFTLSVAGNGRYSGGYNVSPLGSSNADQSQYFQLDASLTVRTADDRWGLSLIGRNLTNQWILLSTNEVPGEGVNAGTPKAVPADALAGIAPPRTVLLRLTWRM